jgi:hypothetical protein
MLTVKSQTQLADATAEMLRACALLTARTASLSASRNLSLWTQMLAASARSPWSMQSRLAWAPLQGWAAWSRACQPQAEAAPAEPPSPDPAFASYRSAGGHAVAQVIVG